LAEPLLIGTKTNSTRSKTRDEFRCQHPIRCTCAQRHASRPWHVLAHSNAPRQLLGDSRAAPLRTRVTQPSPAYHCHKTSEWDKICLCSIFLQIFSSVMFFKDKKHVNSCGFSSSLPHPALQDAQLSCSVWQPSSSSPRYVSCCLESRSSILTGSSLEIVVAASPAQRLLQFSGRSLPRVPPTSRLRLEASLPLTALRDNTTATLSSVRWFMGWTTCYNLAVALYPEYGLLDTRAPPTSLLRSSLLAPIGHPRWYSQLSSVFVRLSETWEHHCRCSCRARFSRHPGSFDIAPTSRRQLSRDRSRQL